MSYSRIKIPAPNDPPEPKEKPPMTDMQLKNVSKAATALFDAFDWSETPEGYLFWDAVNQRLWQIAETGDHRK